VVAILVVAVLRDCSTWQ